MNVVRRKPAVRDGRGAITDIIEDTAVECATVITSRKGAVRGNHYHKKTTQYAYVLEGSFMAYEQRVRGRRQRRTIRAGDLLVTPPLVRHALVALEDSVLVVCTHGPRAGKNYEADTYRLDVLLTGPRG